MTKLFDEFVEEGSPNTDKMWSKQFEHRTWCNMKQRCYNPKNKNYHRYGGRGITVCDRWLEFKNFYADMGVKPINSTLDRIDNDKGYSPENCRWTNNTVQALNRNTLAVRQLKTGYWQARIMVKGKSVSLGMFRGKREAIEKAAKLRQQLVEWIDDCYCPDSSWHKAEVMAKLPEKLVDSRKDGETAQNAIHDYNDGFNTAINDIKESITHE